MLISSNLARKLVTLHEGATFVLGGTGFGIYSNSLSTMNLDTWNSLEPGVQKIIIEAREASIANFSENASAKDKIFYDKFKKAGVKNQHQPQSLAP